ncbi:hypothetical protein RhiirA1_486738 [Rhizophagus irregularis]|uniref:Uncharacterized protein n=1 Tax=Rhizophagus irregularis TaxID=588596 RepID=A0A2I1FRK9_9GLOM|nr:hypothetical protein RhiirA1_486738 [Rhizophagus irregularis]PKY37009.1 hypothetical protein RhiirB3_461032 [Rhizophagus irregularis]
MSFCRSHPRQRRTYEEHKVELEEDNYHLYSELQIEQEIQDLNKKIECLENALKEEIVELKSEISTLKSQLYKARNYVRDKGNIFLV